MTIGILIYLAAGIIARGAFFICEAATRKKYNLKDEYEPMPFGAELFAHALDVVGWPLATVVSFYLLSKEIKKTKGK